MEYLLKAAMPALRGWSKAPDNHLCDLQTLIKCARLFFVYFDDVWITKGPIHTCFWLPHFQSYAGTLPGFMSPGPAPLTSSPLLSPSPCPAGLWMSSTAAATAGLDQKTFVLLSPSGNRGTTSNLQRWSLSQRFTACAILNLGVLNTGQFPLGWN